MPKRPEEMTEAELAEYYYENRHDLAGEEVPSRTPAKMGIMISVRFTQDEARQVRAAAAQANMSVSAYLRQRALAARHDKVVDLDRVRADLRDVRSRAADALRVLTDTAASEA
jgi:mobilization protein NikA